MLDHVSLGVRDFARSRAFYDKALAPLGLQVMVGDDKTYAGYGDERPFFWIGTPEGEPSARAHVAFAAEARARVDAFYAAAIAAGGRDNGPPGPRPHYDLDYYGAFVFDPDGNNVEAVCRAPG